MNTVPYFTSPLNVWPGMRALYSRVFKTRRCRAGIHSRHPDALAACFRAARVPATSAGTTLKGLEALAISTIIPVLLLAGCATTAASGPTQEQSVMKAQFDAPDPVKGEAPSMTGSEADMIYKHYLDGIGKPLGPRVGETTVQSQ